MCGIYGVYYADRSRPALEDTLIAMGDAIRHRGPDESGLLVDGAFGFGMQRLSIIDLKTGHQPIGNEDGSVQVVFNGEIYNYREVARDLVERGHVLTTTSDTEVIVHLWEEYGPDCVKHLSGMFGIAVWDRKSRTLFLARDRMGIKPLYYAESDAGVVFGSELKALLRVPDVARRVDGDAVLAYLRWGYVPDPMSILQGVRKLAPGHTLIVRDGRVAHGPRRYWDPLPFFAEPRLGSEDALLEELRWRLSESVRSHLVADVPLGAFLSGGVDSTAVVAHMAAEHGGSLKTFSIGFEEAEYDERPYARLAAQHFGTDHYELVVRPDSVDRIQRIVSYFDEPFSDASAIPTYFVSELARSHVKVVLSGDGGDEIFAGYERYAVDWRRRHWGALRKLGVAPMVAAVSEALPEGTPGKNFLYDATLPRIQRYVEGVAHYSPAHLATLVAGPAASALARARDDAFSPLISRGRGLGYPARLQCLDIETYLPGDILTKVDRMSMAHSIESRVPLLDHTLVEFVAALPARFTLRRGAGKYLFKRALAGMVPPAILARPKKGFGVPLTYWFREGLQEFIADHLLGPGALSGEYVRRSAVERLFALYRSTGRAGYLNQLWTILVLELWRRELAGVEVAA
ncbi:MAG TPA: asparagine synthase (glutamine-hydrolyzing) [Terriglobales bacterium]|nr:asparagine synthase (glutamine-hydrolyzing) [Terriglobales bacterium]